MNFVKFLSHAKVSYSRFLSTESLDVEKLFLNPKINKLLHDLVDSDPLKVHKPKIMKRNDPQIVLVSNQQFAQMKNEKEVFTRQRLQIPPIKNARQNDKVRVLEQNSQLDQFLPGKNKMIFVDISIQETNRSRLMVVRENNGDLRTVTNEERDRLNQTYFPIPHRQIVSPPLFNKDNLEVMLNESKYIYVLDLNCIQFEPDDSRYISTCHQVYEHINWHHEKLNGIRQLSSTRHFGGLVFYLVLQKNCGNVLLDFLAMERFSAAIDLLSLYCLMHPESNFAQSVSKINRLDDKRNIFEEIELFLQTAPIPDSQKSKIRSTIENYRESKEKEIYSSG